ncbi:FAD binding domain-containing protein [Hygrophoropsis aurantiaca]|uniref:FAD binding domain-containing protein n=1 Tax=Hygrophoropsis aurantiaca TaxID=72124 RepID=A0ACB7ZZQ0_9AGAM|nr:FAD binding domain-containing protein [Hygrophoropsis aurantiaca]
MPEIAHTDVAIIGAGPAGLMAALALSRLGIVVKIIDRRLPGEIAGQADGIQPRMIEIWDSFGIGDRLRRKGIHVHKTARRNGTGITKSAETLNITVSSTKYPYEVLAPIDVIEGILMDALREHHVFVEQPMVPIDLMIHETSDDNHNDYPVEFTLAKLSEDYIRSRNVSQADRSNLADDADAVESIQVLRAKYLIGCDGAHSWVRKKVGISVGGDQTELTWGVIDFTPVTNLPSCRAKNIIQSPTFGAMGYLPRPNDTARMYILHETPVSSGSGDVLDQQLSVKVADRTPQAIETSFLPFKMEATNVTWSSIYKVAQRVAESFSHKNRVFIAGDACHTHSPKGGQGANASMTDACNLAWKLAYVIRGWAAPAGGLLSSYEDERRPFSKALIEFDKEIFKLFNPRGVAPEEYQELWRLNNMFTSGIGLRYSSSLVVPKFHELAPGLAIGERFPRGNVIRQCDWNPVDLQDLMPYDGNFRLLLFPGDINQPVTAHCLQQSVTALMGDRVGRQCGTSTFKLEIIAVLNASKETDMHSLLPELPIPPKNVYVDDGLRDVGTTGKLYLEFGIKAGGGVAALVRPDGHICMLVPLNPVDVLAVKSYLASL